MAGCAVEGRFEDGLTAYSRSDYATALRVWLPLAGRGDPAAQYDLGVMYENGTGVAQDFVQAVKWYRLAADQNNAIAQGNLGYMYANGKGGPQNFIQAYMWFTLAASRFPPSDEKRDLVVENRNAIAAQMTAAQIAEAKRLARNWKPK